ncbi:transposase [Streptomyces viridosporus]|uniref:transposase n=1 Tax=Streptomyces viridosporus TaxID=67581 RepID=UPI0036F9350E
MWVRDHLGGPWRDEDFADRYPRDGRPGLSPARPATVCVLQFLLGLSDRQAAEAVRCRIDLTYAPALEPDDPGFRHSVPADLRERLAAGDRPARLLDLALARLKEAGPVRERTTQRTDSPHVLAAVRDLTRLELVTEAVRAALEEPAGTAPHLLAGLVDEEWGRRYGRPVRLGKNPTRPGPGGPAAASGSPAAAGPAPRARCWSGPPARRCRPRPACPGPAPRSRSGRSPWRPGR